MTMEVGMKCRVKTDIVGYKRLVYARKWDVVKVVSVSHTVAVAERVKDGYRFPVRVELLEYLSQSNN
jgi:hypothetical protein